MSFYNPAMNPCINHYREPSIFEPAPLRSIDHWDWLLSIMERTCKAIFKGFWIEEKAADEHSCYFVMLADVRSHEELIRGLRSAADAMEKAII